MGANAIAPKSSAEAQITAVAIAEADSGKFRIRLAIEHTEHTVYRPTVAVG